MAGLTAWMGSLVQDGQDASGLSYRRNRYYDANSGRFTQEDPIGIAGGLNVYGFGGGDPVSYSDPYGLDDCKFGEDCWAKAIAATWSALKEFHRTWVGLRIGQVANPAMLESFGAAGLLTRLETLEASAEQSTLLEEATVARDELASEVATLPASKRPATVTAGYNTKTGAVAARACGGGQCAEDHVVEALGGDPSVVKFTTAVRPRVQSLKEVPICTRCEANYGRGAFPAGATFKSDHQ